MWEEGEGKEGSDGVGGTAAVDEAGGVGDGAVHGKAPELGRHLRSVQVGPRNGRACDRCVAHHVCLHVFTRCTSNMMR